MGGMTGPAGPALPLPRHMHSMQIFTAVTKSGLPAPGTWRQHVPLMALKTEIIGVIIEGGVKSAGIRGTEQGRVIIAMGVMTINTLTVGNRTVDDFFSGDLFANIPRARGARRLVIAMAVKTEPAGLVYQQGAMLGKMRKVAISAFTAGIHGLMPIAGTFVLGAQFIMTVKTDHGGVILQQGLMSRGMGQMAGVTVKFPDGGVNKWGLPQTGAEIDMTIQTQTAEPGP